MKEIGELLKEKNLKLDTANPVLREGFTQIPNFILKRPDLSVGAKVTYTMFLMVSPQPWKRLSTGVTFPLPKVPTTTGELLALAGSGG